MGQKSSIFKLPPEIRQYIEESFRSGRFTLDELLTALQAEYPDEKLPSRSALGRYNKSYKELVASFQRNEYMSNLLVAELGENPNDKAGALLAQAVTALTTNATLAFLGKGSDEKEGEESIATKEILELARAAKYALEGNSLSRKERLAIEKDARERLLKEQQANLDKTAKAQGMSAEQVQFWREKVLGVK